MGFGGHELPSLAVFHLGTDGHDKAGHLVTEDSRGVDMALGPLVPIEDVHVGSANGGGGDLDQDVLASGLGNGDLVDFGARTGGGFHHCRHGRHD